MLTKNKLMNAHQLNKNCLEGLFSFCLASCILLALHQIHNVTAFPFDSNEYWSLSDPGTFFNFPNVIRGYFYPLLLLPVHWLSNILVGYEFYLYRIYTSLLYGYLLANVLPSVYVQLFGGKLTLLRRLLLPILVAILYPGLIIYPLSDLPAFLLMICALYALTKAKSTGPLLHAAAFVVLAGILAAGAYNTRTIYWFPLIGLLFAVPLYFFSMRPVMHRVMGTLLFILGVGLLSAPQSLINHSRHGTWTPAVVSQSTDKSLFTLQLMWGITMQRYETTIDRSAPFPTRYFIDRVGEQLFVAEDLEKSQVSVVNYLRMVARHPLEFFGIYARHLVSGLDVRDGEVYVRNVKAGNTKIAVFNFVIIAFALLAILVRYMVAKSDSCEQSKVFFRDRTPANPLWPLGILLWLLPACAILPGAVETRFFFPVHAFFYCTIAFNTSIPELHAVLRRHWMLLLGGALLLGALYFGISTSTHAALQPTIPLQYRFGN